MALIKKSTHLIIILILILILMLWRIAICFNNKWTKHNNCNNSNYSNNNRLNNNLANLLEYSEVEVKTEEIAAKINNLGTTICTKMDNNILNSNNSSHKDNLANLETKGKCTLTKWEEDTKALEELIEIKIIKLIYIFFNKKFI